MNNKAFHAIVDTNVQLYAPTTGYERSKNAFVAFAMNETGRVYEEFRLPQD